MNLPTSDSESAGRRSPSAGERLDRLEAEIQELTHSLAEIQNDQRSGDRRRRIISRGVAVLATAFAIAAIAELFYAGLKMGSGIFSPTAPPEAARPATVEATPAAIALPQISL